MRYRLGCVRAAAAVGSVLVAFVSSPSAAVPGPGSAGCHAVNLGGFNIDQSGFTSSYIPVAGFAVGDTVTFTITITGTAQWDLFGGSNNQLLPDTVASTVVAYTVTGSNNDTTLKQQALTQVVGRMIVTATCAPDFIAPDVTLDVVQAGLSRRVASASGAAISGAIDDGIDNAFSGDTGPVTVSGSGIAFNFTAEPKRDGRFDAAFAGLAYADPNQVRSPRLAIGDMWSAWADLRGTGWDGNGAAAGTGGHQLNLTAGIGRRLTPDLVVGIVGGYEHFDYVATTLAGTLKGDGGSVGSYLGWRFGDGLKLDAAAVWSGLAYNATAGVVTGSFSGSRWLLSTGITGTHNIGPFIVEPSTRIFALLENQTAWTDSAAVAHAAQSLSVGRVSAGAKIAYPLTANLTSYLGAYGDYRFGSDAVVMSPAVNVENGLSARITSGLAVKNMRGATISLDGDLGGFGSNTLVWSARVRAGMQF